MRFPLRREVGFQITASAVFVALLLALALAASPQLHARLHADSSAVNHECAATLIASGSYDHPAPPVVLLNPQPATAYATIPAFKVVWVEAAFLGASVFEHAPPIVS